MDRQHMLFLITLMSAIVCACGRLPADDKPVQPKKQGAKTGVLYGCAGGGTEVCCIFEIRDYATATPSVKILGENRVGFGIHDLAVSDTGVIYGVGKASPNNIYTINPNTGVIEDAYLREYASGQNSLAWTTGNILYSAGWQNGEIRKIDLNTKEVKTLAALPGGVGDMAWDPTDGSLYFQARSNELYRFNPVDSKVTVQGPCGTMNGIAIDHTGQMYAWAPGKNATDLRLLSINKKNGQQTLVAEITNTGVNTRASTSGLGAAPKPRGVASQNPKPPDRRMNAVGKDTAPRVGTAISPQASVYLDQVLDVMQGNSVNRNKMDWRSLRAQVRAKAAGAQAVAQTYPAIEFALEQLGDNHSFLVLPSKADIVAPERIKSGGAKSQAEVQNRSAEPTGEMINGRWARVVVPTCQILFNPQVQDPIQRSSEYAARLCAVVRQLDSERPAGWIIDLRGDEGGSMWPMLAGIGPVLGEGEVGATVYPNGDRFKWFYLPGKVLAGNHVMQAVPEAYRVRTPNPPVAVLTSSKTASSGEATTIAFRGRPRTRSFGQPTYGVSTGNMTFTLSDGSVLSLAVATFVDRTGKVYGGAVEPDERVEGNEKAVLKAAVTWLEKQALVPAGK